LVRYLHTAQNRGVVGWERVGTAFPHFFALASLLEDVGSKRLH